MFPYQVCQIITSLGKDCFRLGIQHPLIQKKLQPRRLGGPGVVGDHDDGLPKLLVESLHQLQDLLGRNLVQVTGGFVGHDDGRIGDDGPGNGHPLLLPAR